MTEKTEVPNLAEEDQKKQSLKTKISLLILVFVIMLGGMTVGLGKLYFHNVKLARFLTVEETKLLKLETKVIDLKTQLAYSQKDTVTAQVEVEVMTKRMENIKNSDDLMMRDIELYILNRYRRVPKIVARALAVSIVAACKAEDVSPEVVVGIAEIESQFNPMARNEKSGAIGAMQVMPEWWKKLGLKSVYELYDIPINITSGVKILKIHINEDAKGNLEKGLYFYVGKDSTYAARVFQAAGRFAIFRSTVDDDEKKGDEREEEKAAEGNSKPEAKPDKPKEVKGK